MVPEGAGIPEDLEQLRRRFEEFRDTRAGRARSQTGSSVSRWTNQDDSSCGTVQWTITEYSTGPNTFTLTEYGPNPSVDSCGRIVEQQETANIVINSCGQAQEFFVGGSASGSRFLSTSGGSAQSSSGNSWNRPGGGPGINISADPKKGTARTNLIGGNKTGDLLISITGGNSGQTTTLITHPGVQPGFSATDKLDRTTLPVGQYGSVAATWEQLQPDGTNQFVRAAFNVLLAIQSPE